MSTPALTPLAWPSDLGYGTLVGRFVYLDGDGDDAGDEPDLIPAAGGTVTIEANAQLASYTGAEPMVAVKRQVKGIIDRDGYLCRLGPNGTQGARGIPVVASDSKALSTQGFNYKVSVSIPGATIPPMNVSVLTGQTVDITTAVTESVSGGTKVVALTPEIRAEIAKAVASVQVDTSGLVTTAELQSALKDVAAPDLTGYARTSDIPSVDGLVTADEAEQIALENALLAEGESVRSIHFEVVDGQTVMVQTTSTDREFTIPVPMLAAGGGLDTGRLDVTGWDVRGDAMECRSAWIRREGDEVTLFLYGLLLGAGRTIIQPRAGFGISTTIPDDWSGIAGEVTSISVRPDDEVTSESLAISVDPNGHGRIFWGAEVTGPGRCDVAITWYTQDAVPEPGVYEPYGGGGGIGQVA